MAQIQTAASADGQALRIPAAHVVPGSEEAVTVVLAARIVNRGETSLDAPHINMHAPLQLPHQTIAELDIEGSPERLKDRWDSPVLGYRQAQLAPQATMTGRWTAWAKIRRFQWDLQSSATPTDVSLSATEQSLYLRDAKAFALSDPTVLAAARQAASGRTDETAVLDGIFALVMDRLTYERDGKWQPVPEVLASGKGSCSEYTYCFLSLCRANGIPARYVGGIVGRSSVPYHLDKVFHRYSQAFVPGIGWIDFDPTRTDRATNKRLYFGQTPGPMLLTCVGDGGDGSLTDWDYLESHGWGNKQAQAAMVRMAWWFPQPSAEIRSQVDAFREQLRSTPPDQRAALVEQALAIGNPFVLPWLDDLLYEPAVRVAAARACLKIGEKESWGAVVNSLGRLSDEAGDRQIGQLLGEATGQNLGADRRQWEAWLKAQTVSPPLPGDKVEKKS